MNTPRTASEYNELIKLSSCAAIVFFLMLSPASIYAQTARRLEEATPNITRFTSQKGFEVSFPNTWRVLERPGFDLFIDRLGERWEAATLSFGSANVGANARDEIVADLKSSEPKFLASTINLIRKRFPDAVVLRSGKTVLGNFPAVELVSTYSINSPSARLEVLAWLIVAYKDGKIIRVQFEATGPRREAWMNDATLVVSTFLYQ